MTPHTPWRENAACAGSDVDFFPDPSDLKGLARAQRVCIGCPVKDECADHAYVTGERYGVWAGVNVGIATDAQLRDRKRRKNLDRTERRRQRRLGPLVGPDDPRHGTMNGYVNLGCHCEPCTAAYATYHRDRRHRLRQETG